MITFAGKLAALVTLTPITFANSAPGTFTLNVDWVPFGIGSDDPDPVNVFMVGGGVVVVDDDLVKPSTFIELAARVNPSTETNCAPVSS